MFSPRRSNASRRPASPQARRGVVLIFVVAVLVLLAVIATTYLAMARVDRIAPEVKGGLVSGEDPLPIPTEEIRLDVFNWVNEASLNTEANWRYRPADGTTLSTYRNFDFIDEKGAQTATDQLSPSYEIRQQYDPWLASREPELIGGGPDYGWTKISRWLERWSDGKGWVFSDAAGTDHHGYFESPLGAGGVPVKWNSVSNAIPTYVRVDFPTSFNTPSQYAGKPAVYPALTFTSGPDNGKVVIAGDADGDGVADSGLFPLNSWMVGPTSYVKPDGLIQPGTYALDPASHKTRWSAAVRIVDNNAAINVNTAWRRNVDLSLPMTGPEPTVATPTVGVRPNYGFFRSNIGLFEFLPGLNLGAPFDAQWNVLTRYRLGGRPATGEVTGRTDYVFSSAAEAIEMNIGRRPQKPGPDLPLAGPGPGGVPAGPPYRSFEPALSSNLAYLNGLINPREGRSELETSLIYDLYQFVPNWGAADGATAADKPGADLEKESRSFTFFAAPSTVKPALDKYPPALWWNALYNPNDGQRATYFSGLFAYTGTPPPRTVRQLLTTSNPLATTARAALNDQGTPSWLLTNAARVSMEDFKQGTKAKVSVNTSKFGELWRNFFLTMTDPNLAVLAAATPTDIDPNGRLAPAEMALPGEEALYLRSALAAVNTVDARDGDENITTYRVPLNAAGTKYAMVAGAERQLVIAKIEVVPDATTVPPSTDFSITLKNPYPDTQTPLSTAGYKVGYMPPGGGAYFDVIAVPAATVTGSGNGSTGYAASPVALKVPAAAGTLGHIVLLRTRRADGVPSKNLIDPAVNPYDETGGDNNQLVCLDMVEVGDLTAVAGTYARTEIDWRVACSGRNFTDPNTDVTPNPVAMDNLPVGVSKANAATNNQFPFGGFPRDGDMMMIPYVGHYAFYTTLAAPIAKDVVPVTIDVQRVPPPASPAQIAGRFTPVPVTVSGVSLRSNDWRARIFDNFTTLANPMSDALPNIAADSWLRDIANRKDPRVITDIDPTTVDERTPVHGLVNVNTANLKVLSMVPFVTDASSGTVDAASQVLNTTIAQAIIAYRQTNGPFKSVLDVLSVPEVQAATAMPPTSAQGNFYAQTGAGVGTVAFPVDYAKEYHGFIRISNLLTTRSDSFTVYVLIQQWQDFGTALPVLIPGQEQRFAAIVDRSQLSETERGEVRFQSVSAN